MCPLKDGAYALPNTKRVPTAEWITLSPSACRAKSNCLIDVIIIKRRHDMKAANHRMLC